MGDVTPRLADLPFVFNQNRKVIRTRDSVGTDFLADELIDKDGRACVAVPIKADEVAAYCMISP